MGSEKRTRLPPRPGIRGDPRPPAAVPRGVVGLAALGSRPPTLAPCASLPRSELGEQPRPLGMPQLVPLGAQPLQPGLHLTGGCGPGLACRLCAACGVRVLQALLQGAHLAQRPVARAVRASPP